MSPMPKQKPGRSKQDYQTPIEFVEAVMRRLHIDAFDCDLAASDSNALADFYFTKERSALEASTWLYGEGWNWLNPPYSNIGPWVERAYNEWWKHNTQTAVLIPASVGANWWRDHVHNKAFVLFLNGRLTFVGCDAPYPKDCALLLYDGGAPSYDVWSWQA